MFTQETNITVPVKNKFELALAIGEYSVDSPIKPPPR